MALQSSPTPSTTGRLDGPPPLPPNLAGRGGEPPKQATPEQLAGPGQGQAGGDGARQKAVVEKLMTAHKLLIDTTKIMPELAPIVSQLMAQFQQAAGPIIMAGVPTPAAGGGQPAQPAAPPPAFS